MKILYSSLFVALVLFPAISHAERMRGPYQSEARQDFRQNNEAADWGGGYYDEGYYPDYPPETYRQTPQYQEETLQNAGDPMQEEELQNINDMSNEPDIG